MLGLEKVREARSGESVGPILQSRNPFRMWLSSVGQRTQYAVKLVNIVAVVGRIMANEIWRVSCKTVANSRPVKSLVLVVRIGSQSSRRSQGRVHVHVGVRISVP